MLIQNDTDNDASIIKFKIPDFTVSYESNLGSSVDETPLDEAGLIRPPTAPTRTGYTFAGWYKDKSLKTAWNFSKDIVKQNTTLYAKWTPISYKISYISNNGKSNTTKNAVYGSKLTAPSTPKRTGYIFSGWFKDAGFNQAWSFGSDTVAGDTTLYAQWTPNTYSISYNSNKGSSVSKTSATHGSTISAPSAPTRTGYTFAGWYKDSALKQAFGFDSELITKGITLYAKWTANKYSITYEFNDGSTTPVTVDGFYDSKLKMPAKPTRTGHTFAGWYIDSDLTSAWNFGKQTVAGDMTLYANWAKNTYTITYNSTGGSKVSSVKAQYLSNLVQPPVPKKTGYTFAGWYKEAALLNEWNFNTDTVSSNLSLFAKWILDIPSSFSVQNIDSSTLKISWSKVKGASGYEVYRGNELSGEYSSIYDGNNIEIFDQSLSIGQNYFYKIRSYYKFANTKIFSNYSESINGTPIPKQITNISSSYPTFKSITLNWNMISGVDGYEIFRASNPNTTYEKVAETTLTSYPFSNMTAGSEFYYKIRSFKKIGNDYIYSEFSLPIKFTTGINIELPNTPITLNSKYDSCTISNISYTLDNNIYNDSIKIKITSEGIKTKDIFGSNHSYDIGFNATLYDSTNMALKNITMFSSSRVTVGEKFWINENYYYFTVNKPGNYQIKIKPWVN